MSDEAIKAVGATGGVVASTGVELFLNEKGMASPEEIAENVVYTVDLIGRDKTGFSTDYMHAAKEMFLQDVGNVQVFPPENGFGVPESNAAAEHVWAVPQCWKRNMVAKKTRFAGSWAETSCVPTRRIGKIEGNPLGFLKSNSATAF